MEINLPNYRPTGNGTPNPSLLRRLKKSYCNRWVPVTEALPPERLNVIVIVRGDDTPAFAWLKFGAGDKACPYFICPQLAAMKSRGTHIGRPEQVQHRKDVTHWYSPSVDGLPFHPSDYEQSEWGLSGYGWEHKDERLNEPVFI